MSSIISPTKMSPVLQSRKRNAESRPAKLHGNASSEKYSGKGSESPINLLKVKGFTPGKSRVAITLGKDKSVLYGNVKRKLGMGTEKEVHEVRFCLLINGKRYDRNYAISISRKPGSTLPPDPEGLYFGMTDTGASRVADGDLTHFMTKYPDIPTETLLNKLILPFLQIIKEKHAEKIIHADIKLQNALYMYKTEENEFKAEPSDWGMSQPIGALRRFCGTFDNIPPELYVQYKAHQDRHHVMPITSNSNQDVWGIGSMIAYMLTKKGLSHVFQEKYGMKSYKDVRTDILNLPQHQCMTPEQKNSIQFKRKVSRLLTREINLQYHGVYACPTYSSKDTIDGFKSGVTEPLKLRILDLLTDCFNVDPTLRPSVQHLMSNLSQLTSPISDSTLYSSSESDMGKKIKKQRTLSIIEEPQAAKAPSASPRRALGDITNKQIHVVSPKGLKTQHPTSEKKPTQTYTQSIEL